MSQILQYLGLQQTDEVPAIGVVIAFLSLVFGLVGVLWGARIAGKYSLLATDKLINDQRKIQEEVKKEQAKAVVSALCHEIRCVWRLYMAEVGAMVEANSNIGYRVIFPVNANYFSVYDGSVTSLGIIADADLRNQLIVVYSLAKGLVDTFQYNNQLVVTLDAANKSRFLQNDNGNIQIEKLSQQALDSYGAKIRIFHQNCKEQVALLETLFKKYGYL